MQFKIINGVMDTKPDSQSTFTSTFPDLLSQSLPMERKTASHGRYGLTSSTPTALPCCTPSMPPIFPTFLRKRHKRYARLRPGPPTSSRVPVVTNGKVYVAAHGEVDVYGLLNATANTAAPVINPNGGAFTTSQSVQISSSTPSASIFLYPRRIYADTHFNTVHGANYHQHRYNPQRNRDRNGV